METYSKSLENLLAAAYLSGAAEGLNKCKDLSNEDVAKNLDDIKTLRRKFLERSEEDGYKQPVHHIEEAKQKAYELLLQHTKYPNKNLSSLNHPTISTHMNTTPSNTSTHMNTTPFNTTPSNTSKNAPITPLAPQIIRLGGKRN